MRRVVPVLLVVVALSASSHALAQDDAVPAVPDAYEQDPRELEADVQLQVGRELAAEGRCEVAVTRLERALELADSLDARFHLGACLHALGRHAEALEHIERFASQVDPDVDIERAAVALRILERAREEVGSVALVVDPPSALVMIDGRAVIGTGQRIVRVDAGRHVIRAEYVGHETVVRSIDVEPGSRVLRLVQLHRRAEPGAWLEVETDPPGAWVRVDGRVLRAGHAIELAPGWHRVSAAAPGRQAREREIEVARGERVRMDVTLPEQRDDGLLVLAGTAAVVGAVVLGVAIGFAVGSAGN